MTTPAKPKPGWPRGRPRPELRQPATADLGVRIPLTHKRAFQAAVPAQGRRKAVVEWIEQRFMKGQ